MSFFRRKKLPSAIKPSVTFGRLLYQRLDHDGLTMLAGHLAYVSLLSLVPLVTVVFALFAAFPMFSDISEQLKSFIFPISCRPPATSYRTTWNSSSPTPTR